MTRLTNISYIYYLRDPRTNEVRYVGKSVTPTKRLHDHSSVRKKMKTHKEKWVLKLEGLGLKPIMDIVRVVPLNKASEFEIKEIAKFKHLTNGTVGGEGGVTWPVGKKRPSWVGEKISKLRKEKGLTFTKRARLRSAEVNRRSVEGIGVGTFNSILEAASIYKIDQGNIVKACKGQRKTAGGIVWKYTNR